MWDMRGGGLLKSFWGVGRKEGHTAESSKPGDWESQAGSGAGLGMHGGAVTAGHVDILPLSTNYVIKQTEQYRSEGWKHVLRIQPLSASL